MSTEELRRLRDERAALEVADDRERLSQELDLVLRDRLAQLTAAAESGSGLEPAQARELLQSIEDESRRTLDDMREHLVGALADHPRAPAHVEVRFDDDVLEIVVAGPVSRGGDVRAAVARARERATLLGGSLDISVNRGRARARAMLPTTV